MLRAAILVAGWYVCACAETTFRVAGSAAARSAQNVAVVGTTAYVAGSSLMTFDVSDIENPTPLAEGMFLAGVPSGISVSGGFAYLTAGSQGLQVFDVADPANPVEVSRLPLTPDGVFSVTVVEELAYVGGGLSGLRIVNVSNAAEPTVVGTLNTDGQAQGVVVVGTVAYVADGFNRGGICNLPACGGLRVVDVADPTAPVLLGSVDKTCLKVAVSGSTAFCSQSDRIVAYDVSTPAAPVVISELEMSGRPFRLRAEAHLLYISLSDAGFAVADYSDPAAPVLVTTVDLGPTRSISTEPLPAFIATVGSGQLTLLAVEQPGTANPCPPSHPVFLCRACFVSEAQAASSGCDPAAPIPESPCVPPHPFFACDKCWANLDQARDGGCNPQ